jgi:NADPH:quinone reductase-like Zn-dependent oxidoreductase
MKSRANVMKAVRIHEFGGPEVLKYEDAPRPESGPGEVLVRVYACGVNPADWKTREGRGRERPRQRLPLIPGWDLSGAIERLGPDVSGFDVGEDVYGRPDMARDGAYAEFIVVRAGELARKPRTLSHVEAAAVPLAALTAWQTLFDAPPPHSSLGVTRGQTVLIHGAAGGVGTFAVQLAKWKGAKVIATASARNHAFLRELGADVVIDYHQQRFEDVVRDVDAVLDTVGGETLARSWAVLKRGGILASTTLRVAEEEARDHQARSAYVFVQPDAGQLEEIARLVDEKVIRPIVSQVFPLIEAEKAHRASQEGHVRGKIVLEVRTEP